MKPVLNSQKSPGSFPEDTFPAIKHQESIRVPYTTLVLWQLAFPFEDACREKEHYYHMWT